MNKRWTISCMAVCAKGFTLIELLAVMGIMVLMASIVATSYFGAMRGSGMRMSVSHLRSTLMLARQKAIMDGKRTYIFFNQTPNNVATNGSYIVCQAEGETTDVNGFSFADKWNPDLGTLIKDTTVYNMTNQLSSKIDQGGVTYDAAKGYIIKLKDKIFSSAGDKYGFELQPRQYLQPGFRFGSGSDVSLTTLEKDWTMVFRKDGSVVKNDGHDNPSSFKISIYEEISGQTFRLDVSGSGNITTVTL